MCTNSNTQPSNGQQLSPDAFIENSQNDTQKMNTFTAYEKAIEGYQFQVGRYNIWMNYYAIFVGAYSSLFTRSGRKAKSKRYVAHANRFAAKLLRQLQNRRSGSCP